jgi:hypothetical protein
MNQKERIISAAIDAACNCEDHEKGSVPAGFLGLAISNAIDEVYDLTAPQPSPVCSRCGDPLRVGVCENCLPDIPQPEASDREIDEAERSLRRIIFDGFYTHTLGTKDKEDADILLDNLVSIARSNVDHDATIRADERRKVADRAVGYVWPDGPEYQLEPEGLRSAILGEGSTP